MFERADYAERSLTVALNSDDRVHEMLQRPRPGEFSFLGDVADDE